MLDAGALLQLTGQVIVVRAAEKIRKTPLLHHVQGDPRLLALGRREVPQLVGRDQPAEFDVAPVGVGAPAPSAEDVVGARGSDVGGLEIVGHDVVWVVR